MTGDRITDPGWVKGTCGCCGSDIEVYGDVARPDRTREERCREVLEQARVAFEQIERAVLDTVSPPSLRLTLAGLASFPLNNIMKPALNPTEPSVEEER